MMALAANLDLMLEAKAPGYMPWLIELIYGADLVNMWLDEHRLLDDDPAVRRQNLDGAVRVLRMFRMLADFTLLSGVCPVHKKLRQAASRLDHFVGPYVRSLDDYA